MTHRQLETELDLAMMALQSGKTRAQRREAFAKLRELKARQAEDAERVRQLEEARGLTRR